MKKWTYIVTVMLLISLQAKANKVDGYPQIGEPFPKFVLNDIHHYDKQQASLADFRGKWLVLDFWGEYCTGCIESFPKMNAIQQRFADHIQIILVGEVRDNPATVQRLYEKHREKHGLILPIVYDNELKESFDVGGYPFIMIIDPNGILRAVTYQLNTENMEEFLQGGEPSLPRNYFHSEFRASYTYNRDIPLLINGNGGDESEYLYRSLITRWNEAIPKFVKRITDNKMELFGMDLETIYRFAYTGRDSWFLQDTIVYGKYWPRLIVESADSLLFTFNDATGENFFCYSLTIPSKPSDTRVKYTPDDLFLRILRQDLANYFPFIVVIETRKMPCYMLVIDKQAFEKLKSKNNTRFFEWKEGYGQGFISKSTPISGLISYISNHSGYPGFPFGVPLLYDGNKEECIDLEIDSIFFDDLLVELESYGITLVPIEREMKVIVAK